MPSATPQDWNTRSSLIRRIRDRSPEAWQEFESIYQGFIRYILGKMNIPTVDRDDISQEVVLKIWSAYQKGTGYEKIKDGAKFRTWLGKVIKNTALNFRSRNHRHTHQHYPLDPLEDGIKDPKDDLQTMIEMEWQKHLIDLALEQTKKRFRGKAVDVFLLAMDEVPHEEICSRLKLNSATCHTYKHRVKKCFQQELQRLRRELEVDPEERSP